ncbi:hypothetical protein AURANDRAFT_68400 [Aureococcus anophagefferens]|uniref:Uncharacterized protein n=1 Tax=Aureococcus anophagefferens TaxID=44056 RepID=F0YPI6_AURAN|nr:hypothetical protein AURANDRAFT_68400 [Aureococcus anophagefferens]EGB02972.1 hypothetical protein AURANDRAFT_68400 [Aureococcus anophagefferens]|eukprot:XP_009042328.1 hypothetical protein AURANDRAFT_68400 [Aureococcus anophagefferens]
MATNLVDWLDADGDVEHVPPHVKQALEAPWRGQDDLKGAKARATLSFFTEEAVFIPMDQVRRTRTTPNKLTAGKNTGTYYKLKASPDRKPWYAKYGRINQTKLMEIIIKCEQIDDVAKEKYLKDRSAASAKKWLREYSEKQQKEDKEKEQLGQLEAAEVEQLPQVEKDRRARSSLLEARLIRALSAGQVRAIHYALSTFFFVCRIPFVITDHWAFRRFIKALAPEYEPHCPKRTALSTTWLSHIHEEVEQRTESAFHGTRGRATVIIDGFKDRRRRHVMNISKAKVGIPVYLKTSWFGAKRHSGETYGKEVENCIGDGLSSGRARESKLFPCLRQILHTILERVRVLGFHLTLMDLHVLRQSSEHACFEEHLDLHNANDVAIICVLSRSDSHDESEGAEEYAQEKSGVHIRTLPLSQTCPKVWLPLKQPGDGSKSRRTSPRDFNINMDPAFQNNVEMDLTSKQNIKRDLTVHHF